MEAAAAEDSEDNLTYLGKGRRKAVPLPFPFSIFNLIQKIIGIVN